MCVLSSWTSDQGHGPGRKGAIFLDKKKWQSTVEESGSSGLCLGRTPLSCCVTLGKSLPSLGLCVLGY